MQLPTKLEEHFERSNLGGMVTLLPRLPQSVLLTYIKAADLFVLNTLYEGFSHQLLEVMAMRTPIVTTRVGGNPELIEDRRSGLLVPPSDDKKLVESIGEALLDQPLRQKLIDGAARRVLDFSRAAMVDTLLIELKLS